ncbi:MULTISPECIES: hypothetical protein [unclassified Streptomyces]|uniref:hypothetical protein n=1 Tax=unclassified Streptomyces TaxID=2593676 RepID=UPI0036F1481A
MATEPETTPAAPTHRRLLPARSIRRRKRLERLTYGAATLGITLGPHSDLWPAHAGAAALTVGTALWLWNKWETTTIGLGLLKACQKAVPFLTGSGLYVASLLVDGADWWEYAAPAGWGLLMAAATPLTNTLGMIPAPPATAPQLAPATGVTAPAPVSFAVHRTGQWATAKSTGTTRLAEVHQYQQDAPDFWGIVVAEEGDAVPDLNPVALGAVFDFPPGTVRLDAIQGSGPGRKLLQARPTLDQARTEQQDPLVRIFNERLARTGGGADGMQLVAHRAESNRIVFRVAAPEDQFIQLNQKQIARSLKYKDKSLVMIETDGMADGVISVYKNHPLLTVREATVEDLTMDADGTIAIGLRPDGRQARIPLYDPTMGAITDLFVGAPGAGKSVTLLTVIAAERINGIVSIVADAQDGMSLPEVDGRVYHFGKGVAATAATLAASNDLGKFREKVSAANGWGSFEPGSPWRISNDTLDELNRILSEDATVPRAFRKWVTGLVGDNQATGRKLGKGIRFAAQSIHLADLGDKDRIRANAKNGTVWGGRTNSSTTQHMMTDGVLPPGVHLEPIPRYFNVGAGSSIDAAFQGKEVKNGPITAGMANIIQGGQVFLARTWFARKENKTYPGLIALMESAPIPRLSPEEDRVFQESYARWLPYAEALLAGEDEDGQTGEYTADIRSLLDDDEDNDQPSTGSIKERILDALAGGPMALKDVRKKMPDVAPGSVNNVMQELREAGHVAPVSRGIYQLTSQ